MSVSSEQAGDRSSSSAAIEQVDAGVDQAAAARSRPFAERCHPIALQCDDAIARRIVHPTQQHPSDSAVPSALPAHSSLARLQSNSESPLHSRNRSSRQIAGVKQRAAGAGPRRLSATRRSAPRAAAAPPVPARGASISSERWPVSRTNSSTPKRTNSRSSQAEERPIAARQQRLRRACRQRAEACAQPAGKHGALANRSRTICRARVVIKAARSARLSFPLARRYHFACKLAMKGCKR